MNNAIGAIARFYNDNREHIDRAVHQAGHHAHHIHHHMHHAEQAAAARREEARSNPKDGWVMR